MRLLPVNRASGSGLLRAVMRYRIDPNRVPNCEIKGTMGVRRYTIDGIGCIVRPLHMQGVGGGSSTSGCRSPCQCPQLQKSGAYQPITIEDAAPLA